MSTGTKLIKISLLDISNFWCMNLEFKAIAILNWMHSSHISSFWIFDHIKLMMSRVLTLSYTYSHRISGICAGSNSWSGLNIWKVEKFGVNLSLIAFIKKFRVNCSGSCRHNKSLLLNTDRYLEFYEYLKYWNSN